MQEKFERCLLGVAIGDAMGMPVEGMTRDQIKRTYGEVRDFLPSPYGDLNAGEWTDDTEQMIVLAESILSTVYFDPADFAERLKRWFLSTGCRRIGPTTSRAMQRLLSGADWSEAGVESETCGAAMRVAPVGLVYGFSLNLVERYAALAARVTHTAPAAVAAAVAIAVGVACNVLGIEGEELLEEVTTRVERYDRLLAEKVRWAYDLSDEDIDSAIERLGNSISSLDATPMAFYCFFSTESFEECVIKAVNAGGDADSIAAMSGALAGSEGRRIPDSWIDSLKDAGRIKEIANRLYELRRRITS